MYVGELADAPMRPTFVKPLFFLQKSMMQSFTAICLCERARPQRRSVPAPLSLASQFKGQWGRVIPAPLLSRATLQN